jgi:predicted DNA-binding antitoxin AbrB/MazE fold protein
MVIQVKAIYEDGHLRLLTPVNLSAGQQVQVTIKTLSEDDQFRLIFGDSVRLPNLSNDDDAYLEQEADNIAQALSGGKPLSEIIIEDRGEW